MANWGERLQRILDKQGIKQKELAEKIEVTPSNVSQLIDNAYSPLQKIEKICEALDIKLWQFFMEDDGESMKDYVPKRDDFRTVLENIIDAIMVNCA
jgi:transcriptional regulator with XRE-family HTH domain